jgi:hypothetical protein
MVPSNAQVLKVQCHIQSTITPTCFDVLQIILRELYIREVSNKLDIFNPSNCGYHKIGVSAQLVHITWLSQPYLISSLHSRRTATVRFGRYHRSSSNNTHDSSVLTLESTAGEYMYR